MAPATKRRVCIVVPGFLSSAPRTVKEADALHAAGFSVRVVFLQGASESLRLMDDTVLASRSWESAPLRISPLKAGERFVFHSSRIRHNFLRRLPREAWAIPRVAENAEGRTFEELTALAERTPADLYLGHYPTGLAAAASAARRWGSRYGYDIEDLHTEERPAGSPSLQSQRIETIERRYVQNCAMLTAVSRPVAEFFSKRYASPMPVVLHNVFPFAERKQIDGLVLDRCGTSPSFCWYSQVVGHGRGVEDLIRAAARLSRVVQVHLRGTVSVEVKASLQALAAESGFKGELLFHEQVPPDTLLSRLAEHDVGFAVEQPHTLNHQLTVSNKLFQYLTAGLAVAATEVRGQAEILQESPGVGFLYPPGDIEALASRLEWLLATPGELQAAKRAALRAAELKWNWELESGKFVCAVDRLLCAR